ncbi:hypothetical protein [Neorhizobium galegae]|uniref:hypothetical protein n=1 Tax=Neorhizobium galegae TaxID=399 RepID=UPI0012D5F133|nr:hypothetical protein [Neorhizobium galegae]KAB1123029.1 hypothetical protein F4V90_20310 [Neorhizobium galegae]MCQ1807510.1 hypothetical protein [Neorhizobium galegae]UIY32107.1 hypothetical protein LZK73_24805 [Neorhizobium galegae]
MEKDLEIDDGERLDIAHGIDRRAARHNEPIFWRAESLPETGHGPGDGGDIANVVQSGRDKSCCTLWQKDENVVSGLVSHGNILSRMAP